MNKYFHLIQTSIQKQLIYRTRFLFWVLTDLIQIFIMPFIWLAIYGNRNSIDSYSRMDIITYYIVIAFVSIATASHHQYYVKRDIMNGRLSDHLVKPIQYLIRSWAAGLGYNICGGVIVTAVIACFYFFFPTYIALPKHPSTWLLFFFALILANILSCLTQFLVGMSSFWFKESNNLGWIRNMTERLFSGEFAPLALYPITLQTIAKFLPFQFLFFIPVQIYLEKYTVDETLKTLLLGSAWFAVLLLANILTWKRGLLRYDGSGI